MRLMGGVEDYIKSTDALFFPRDRRTIYHKKQTAFYPFWLLCNDDIIGPLDREFLFKL
jgi:hypothetical protein